MPKQKDLVGTVSGYLTVLSYAGRYKHGGSQWLCLCSLCGKEVIKPAGYIASGRKSCSAACGVSVSNKERSKHGQWLSPEYRTWSAIKRRCFNSSHASWPRYGGRGITMCEEWCKSFDSFLAYVGERPSPLHSLDRINNDGNYEPGNVMWATKKEQSRNRCNNRMVEYNGEEKCLADWADTLGIKATVLYGRWHKGVRGDALFSTKRLRWGSISKQS